MIKVADFGLSESMDTTKEYFRQNQDNTVKLPIKWLAIESINDGVFSEKSDVVGWELLFKKCATLLLIIIVGIWSDVLGGV